MRSTIRYVGLDVHKEKIVIAVAEKGEGKTYYPLPSEKARYKTDREVEPAGRNGPSPCPLFCPRLE